MQRIIYKELLIDVYMGKNGWKRDIIFRQSRITVLTEKTTSISFTLNERMLTSISERL